VNVSSLRRGLAEPLAVLARCRPWGVPNDTEIRVLAMRRSGHHAVVNWVLAQAEGWACFLNDCQREGNPYATCRPSTSVVPVSSDAATRLFWKAERSGVHTRKSLLMYNFEDAHPEPFAAGDAVAQSRRWVGRSGRVLNVLVLRDPFNLFASRLRWLRGRKGTGLLKDPQQWVALWKAYAREAAGVTDHVPDRVCVSYNAWCLSESYRRGLAERLGLPFTDAGRQEVARWGPTVWGDSFDGLRYDGRAEDMDVLERWKQFQDDPVYRGLFEDPELVALSRTVFGDLPGTDSVAAP
jgi:hypothetical protein